jgi:flagellar hook-associated protein 3 FlgL
MDLRVTFQTMIGNALTNTQAQTAQIANLQEQAATGLRVLQSSDDPAATQMVMASQTEQSQLDAYLSNISSTQSTLNTSVSALQHADNILSQAKSIALEASSSTNDTSSLSALASQVDQLITQMLGVANTQQNGAYIYGGTATRAAPFVTTGTDSQGRPTGFAYKGSDQAMQVAVSANHFVTTYAPGDQMFASNQGTQGGLQVLLALRDDLRNTAGLSQTQQIQTISNRVGDLDTADQGILQVQGQQSAQLQTLTYLQSRTQDMKLSSQTFISGLRDADMAQVAVKLQAQENQLQLTLAATAKMFDQNLLQYIH